VNHRDAHAFALCEVRVYAPQGGLHNGLMTASKAGENSSVIDLIGEANASYIGLQVRDRVDVCHLGSASDHDWLPYVCSTRNDL